MTFEIGIDGFDQRRELSFHVGPDLASSTGTPEIVGGMNTIGSTRSKAVRCASRTIPVMT